MPHINSRGDFCHGVGGGYVNLNNVAICSGGVMGWMDDDTIAFANGSDIADNGWAASKYHVPTQTITRLSEPPIGSVVGYAGGGHAAWTLRGLHSTTGFNNPDAGLINMGPDGSIAYKPVDQSYGPTVVRELDGSEWQLTPNHAYDLCLIGNRRGIWNDTVTGLTVVGLPKPNPLPGRVWFPNVFFLADVPWLGYYSELYGLVAHPMQDNSNGWTIVRPEQYAWPTFRALGATILKVCWSNSPAEQAEQITPVVYDLNVNPLQAFVAPVIIPHTDTPHIDITTHSDAPPHSDIPKHSDTPHMTPIKSNERYWLHPNIDSDVVAACHADVSAVDVFGLYGQWILEDARYDKLDSLADIRKQGVNLSVEMGCVKPGDYHGEKAQSLVATVAERVAAKGHQVSWIVMDEPLTGIRQKYDENGKLVECPPVQPLEEVAFAIAKFVQKIREEIPNVKVAWAEAWPNIDLEEMRKCLMILDSWGSRLDGWHLDVDWKRATKEKSNAYSMIRAAKQYADDYRVQLGVYLVGYPHTTDKEYYDEVVGIAEQLHTEASFCVDHVLVQSWATRGETGPQNLPENLTADGLFPLFKHVQENIFV
jgi:hypothetical protein